MTVIYHSPEEKKHEQNQILKLLCKLFRHGIACKKLSIAPVSQVLIRRVRVSFKCQNHSLNDISDVGITQRLPWEITFQNSLGELAYFFSFSSQKLNSLFFLFRTKQLHRKKRGDTVYGFVYKTAISPFVLTLVLWERENPPRETLSLSFPCQQI